MYSHEDQLRTVELYFKYGKKVVQIVSELGYPLTKQLRRWIQAWQTRDVLVERVRRKPRYTDMQKHAAVEHYLNYGCCLAFTWRTLGYPSDVLLSHWVDELHPGGRQILSSIKNLDALTRRRSARPSAISASAPYPTTKSLKRLVPAASRWNWIS